MLWPSAQSVCGDTAGPGSTTRGAIYYRVAYPRRRGAAEARYAQTGRHAHAFFLLTSYKVEADITARVYRAAFEAAARSPGGATVVASLVEAGDERLVRSLFNKYSAVLADVALIVDRIPGTGKRDALATSLRTIAKQRPARDDIVLLIDVDTCVPVDIAERSAPHFSRPEVGAVTTDELSEAIGSRLFSDWFALRFTQRQMMMSAVALGRRVLTLTGRLTVFRAAIAIDPDFIASVRSDYIDHWRLGRVNFLSGDDKSTWFWLLKNRYEMVYMPDVQAVSMETQPRSGFVESAVVLMTRWFGNMLRTNSRALRLSPFDIGLFTWWSILEQRISMWTTLSNPDRGDPVLGFRRSAGLPRLSRVVMFTRYHDYLLPVVGFPRPVPDHLSIPALFRPGHGSAGEELHALPAR